MKHHILPFKVYSLLVCLLCVIPIHAAIGMAELGDSLTMLTGFSPAWSAPVRVKAMRVNGNRIDIYTNATLGGVRWTKEEVNRYNLKVSQWLLGNNKGKVTIYTNRQPVSELITDCANGKYNRRCPNGRCGDLSERNIALWPSHGLYYNTARNEWIWQRATLWTTVEDLYSQEYVRLIKQMLENAGATVFMPRAGLESDEEGPSGMPRWTEGARYWLESQGADSTIWDLYEGDHYKDDMKSRCMWVNSLNQPIDLCLALHTDGVDSGDDSTIVGSLAIYTVYDDDGNRTLRDGRNRQKTNRNLADWILTQVTRDLRHIAPEWTRRQLLEANYCESRVPVVPAIILELISHKNMADMRYGLDPHFRFAAARAVYKGILRYINGPDAVIQPLPVQDMMIDSEWRLSWTPVLDSIEPAANPEYYFVYTQENDGEWNVQQVDKPFIRLTRQEGVRINCYVVAANDGGLSLPGPTLSAYHAPSAQQSNSVALIVDAFSDVYGPEWFADSVYAGIVPGSYACEDRFSCAYIGQQWDYTRAHPWINDDNCGWGACYRDHAGLFTIGNTHDYAVLHGRVLSSMGISYVSCTANALNSYPLDDVQSPFAFIDYVCGRNRTPVTEQNRQWISDFVRHGGRLILSGDNMDRLDSQWAKDYLHCTPYANHATRSGMLSLKGNRRPYRLLLEPNEHQLFSNAPCSLMPYGEQASAWAEYIDMRCPAAVVWYDQTDTPDESQQSPRTLVWGFPLEAATHFEHLLYLSISRLLQ